MCSGLKCQLQECEEVIQKLKDALEKRENEAEILRVQIDRIEVRKMR